MTTTTAIASICLLAAFVGGPNVINGTHGDDELFGSLAGDVINGHAGDDQLRGGEGDDILNGGEGDDFLLGSEGDDLCNGGPGADIIRPLVGDDVVHAGAGDDRVQLQESVEIQVIPMPVPTGADHDVVECGGGDDEIQWASGHTYFMGIPLTFAITGGDAEADGGGGFDMLEVGTGDLRGRSSDYVIEPGTLPAYSWRVRALATGNVIHLRNVEAVEFLDATVML